MDRRERWLTTPLDTRSAAGIAEAGLRYGLVDTADTPAFDAWLRAEARGFHGPQLDTDGLARGRATFGDRRTTGVWDPATPDPAEPVATVNSWIAELTLSPGRTVEAWAVSGVTVSPTHRRRGIARNLLEGELRAAAAAGVPIATLTVSESTIYGRFGFGPAAMMSDLTIETSRARWIGRTPRGRLDHLDPTAAADLLGVLHDEARLGVPGDTDGYPALWPRVTGALGDPAKSAPIRSVRYTGTDGRVTGAAVYRLSGAETDFTKHRLEVDALVAVDDDAYAALWRFLLEMDLVEIVFAHLRAVDEPVRFMLADFRGVADRVTDHHWLRVLDAPAVFGGRAYGAAGRVGLQVADDLGFADGAFVLTVDDEGVGVLEPVASLPDDLAAVRIGIDVLGSIALGGVRASTLVRAGRAGEAHAGDALAVDRLLAAERAPWLSTWY